MSSLFEPLAACSLLHLSMKVTFFVAITLARRVGELCALMSGTSYMIFFKDKFIQSLSQSGVVFPCQPLYLPAFCPKPHSNREEEHFQTLDVRRALAFYLDRTRHFRKSSQLFIAVADRIKGESLSTQIIFSWIVSCIHVYYDLVNIIPPSRVTTHLTRLQLSLVAFLAHAPISDICRAQYPSPQSTCLLPIMLSLRT